jgi:hypothetical protein
MEVKRCQNRRCRSYVFRAGEEPVIGEPEGIRIEHESGFIFKGIEVVSARECWSSIDELDFSWPNHAGFVTRVQYGNQRFTPCSPSSFTNFWTTEWALVNNAGDPS